MERREFLKLTLGLVAAAGAIATTVTTAEAAPLPDKSKAPPDGKADETAARSEAEKVDGEAGSRDEDLALAEDGDTEFSARRWWRRRRRWWRRRRRIYFRRRRRFWRRRRRWWRRRRVIYY